MSQDKKTDNKVTIREHVFDGIQEYDQKLPNWWLFTLYITIVWFVIAWFIYYQTPVRTLTDHERIDAKVAVIEEKKRAELESMLATLSDDALKEMSADVTHNAAGKAIYETKCLPCHAPNLGGIANGPPYIGVALNDTEWKYGGKPLEIMKTVTNGSPDLTKGMIAWKAQLSAAEIAQVVAYILSKQPQS
jgi:cytochrome c oxidase cbb3-type subunit 3